MSSRGPLLTARTTERKATSDLRAKCFSRTKAAIIDVHSIDWAETTKRSMSAVNVIARVIQLLRAISLQRYVAFLPSIPEPYPNQRKVRKINTARLPTPPPKRLKHPVNPRHSFNGRVELLDGMGFDEIELLKPSDCVIVASVSRFNNFISESPPCFESGHAVSGSS